MCTVIAKESATRVCVVTGIPCCVSVEEVQAYIPKVCRENGWFELFVGDLETEVPHWASCLEGEGKRKALAGRPAKCRGKRVWFYDVSDRYPPQPPTKKRFALWRISTA